jgi:hypothetical protein
MPDAGIGMEGPASVVYINENVARSGHRRGVRLRFAT